MWSRSPPIGASSILIATRALEHGVEGQPDPRRGARADLALQPVATVDARLGRGAHDRIVRLVTPRLRLTCPTRDRGDARARAPGRFARLGRARRLRTRLPATALQRDAEPRQRHGAGAVADAADRRRAGVVLGQQRDRRRGRPPAGTTTTKPQPMLKTR